MDDLFFEKVAESSLLDFDDYKAVRSDIFDRIHSAVGGSFPIKNDKYAVSLDNLQYKDADYYSKKEQKKALLQGKSLTRKLVGDLTVTDLETGQTVSRAPRKTLMNVPYFTDRGTFIRNGVEYTIAKQFRLIPNVYTRNTAAGTIESQFNVKPRTGMSFRIEMDPSTSIFTLKSGGRVAQLYPILQKLGVTDEELAARWGKEILKSNQLKRPSPHTINWINSTIEKGLEKTAADTPVEDPEAAARTSLINYFNKMELTPAGTQSTLGTPYSNVTPASILDSTSKILRISRNQDTTDDRDSLEYQTIHDMSDFLSEKVKNDQNGVLRNFMWKLTGKQGQADFMPAGILDAHNAHLFNNSGMAQALEEISLFDNYNQNHRVMRLGEGAMASVDVAPKECFDRETEVFTKEGWVSWEAVTEDTLFACRIEGRLEFHKAYDLVKYPYTGTMYGAKSRSIEYLVTPNHRFRYKSDPRWGWQQNTAEHIFNKASIFPTTHKPVLGTTPNVFLPIVDGARKVYDNINLGDFAELLGWYISEGSIDKYALKHRSKFHITISQDKTVNPEHTLAIDALLSNMGIAHSYHGHNFVFVSKQIGTYFSKLGTYAHNKQLPEEVFEWPVYARKRLLQGLVDGDGYTRSSGGFEYGTVSKVLAKQVERLGISLGYSVRPFLNKKADPEKGWLPLLGIRFLLRETAGITPPNHYMLEYDGFVYCANVPGEHLLVRRHNSLSMWTLNSRAVQPSYIGFCDPIRSPESLRVGLDMYMARGVRKGKDNLLYSQFINPRTGKKEWVNQRTAATSVIAFPGALNSDDKFVPAMVKAKGIFYVPREEVEYEIASGDDLFSRGANTVPLKSGVKGMRLLMGCLSPDTKVLIRREDKSIFYDSISEYTWKDGDKTISTEGCKTIWRDVRGVHKNTTELDLLEVTLKSGRALKTTNTHKWVTMAEDGSLQEIYTDMLRIGTPIPRVKSIAINIKSDADKSKPTVVDYKVESWVFSAPVRVRKDVINRYKDVITSKSFRDDIALLYTSLGIDTSFSYSASGRYIITPIDTHPDIDVSWDCVQSIVPLGKVTESYDLDLDDNVYMSGCGIITHNSKYPSQALPLVRREAPLVQCTHEDGTSESKYLGKFMGAVRADKPGIVKKIDKDSIRMQYDDGTEEDVSIYSTFPFSRKTGITNYPTVKVGQRVDKDTLLASSNFTDDSGLAAPGINLRVAYMGYQGKNFEDATVISESASKKLTAETMYTTKAERQEGLSIDKRKYTTLFPGIYSKDQLNNIDDNGVIKEGTVVNYGDPILLGTKARIPSLSNMGRRVTTDESKTWDHHASGVITDVSETKNGYQIYARSNSTALEGDKVSLAFGTKGVISFVQSDDKMPKDAQGRPMDILISPLSIISRCYDEGTEFLTGEGWKFGKDVLDTDKIMSYDPCTKDLILTEQLDAFHKALYTGKMLKCTNVHSDFCVTPQHTMWAKCNYPGGTWQKTTAERIAFHDWKVPTVGNPIMGTDSNFNPPQLTYSVKETLLQKKDWEEIDYSGYIYCPTVPTGFVLTRRNGKPIIAGNTNPSQLVAVALGKVAEKTGKPYVLPGFSDQSLVQFAKDELKKNGLTDTEDLDDPVSNKKIPQVFTGMTYVYRLQQTAESKGKSRATGSYSQDEDPGRGGKEGAKHIGDMELQALLAHGVCFLPGTLVETSKGSRRIEDIVKYRQQLNVKALDKATKTPVWKPITDWIATSVPRDSFVRVKTSASPKPILCTKGHKFITEDGEKHACELKEGDWVYSAPDMQLKPEKVISQTPYTLKDKDPSIVYNITVQDVHTYTAGGVFVGNSDVIKDLKLVKGQKNDEFWRQVKLGQTPATPSTPFVYSKFKDLIRAAGVHLTEGRKQDSIFAMTNEQAKELTGNRKITSGATFSAEHLKPINSGLFDPASTGSLVGGDRFAYIELPEPMLNPVMEAPIKSILGLNQREIDAVLSGETVYDNKRGGAALKAMLDNVNLKQLTSSALEDIKEGVKSKRNAAIKKYGYAKAMLEHKVSPSDFIMDRVPVLPPKYRPITRQGSLILSNEPNYMYKAMFDSMDDFKDSKELPLEMQNAARDRMYKSYKGLIGITEPIQPELQQKRIGGILPQIFGKGSPKASWVQRKLLGTNIDISGSAVVAPDPNLKLNEVGMPIEQAWDLYEPFVIRHLVMRGMPATVAAQTAAGHGKQARAALEAVVKERPILFNRAPTLHKYSIMAFWPKLIEGHVLKVAPGIEGPLGQDYDGDCLTGCIAVTYDLNAENTGKLLDKSSVDTTLTLATKGESMLAKESSVSSTTGIIPLEMFPKIASSKVDKSATVSEWLVPPGVKVYALDPVTHKHKYYPVTHFSQHRDLKMFDVTLGKWYSKIITTSEDHSLIVYDGGKLITAKPEEALHKMVPVCANMLNLSSSDTVYKMSNGSTDVYLDFNSGVFIGAMLGDGWVDNAGKAAIASAYPEFVTYMQDIISKTDFAGNNAATYNSYPSENIVGDITDRGKIYVNGNKKTLALLADKIGRGFANKVIPDECLRGSKNHLTGLLIGLLSTDGSVFCKEIVKKGKQAWNCGAAYCTLSPNLRDTFTHLCKILGIRTTVSVSTHNDKAVYTITLCKPDFVNFAKATPIFKMPIQHKQDALEGVLLHVNMQCGISGSIDMVPYPIHLHTLLLRLNKQGEKVVGYADLSTIKSNGCISRYKALELSKKHLTNATEEESAQFKEWRELIKDTNVLWNRIEDVSYNPNITTAYDITVPGPFTFATSDGIIVQDTGHYTVPVSDKAVKQAIDKMMPEKNLLSAGSYKPHYVPTQEYTMGLYYASKEPANKPVKTFRSRAEANKAYARGEINTDDPIIIVP